MSRALSGSPEQQCLDTPLIPIHRGSLGAGGPGSPVRKPGVQRLPGALAGPMEFSSHSVQGRAFSSPGEQLPNSFRGTLLLLFTNEPEPGLWKSPIKFTTAPLSAASSKIPGMLALLGGLPGQRFREQRPEPCVTRP